MIGIVIVGSARDPEWDWKILYQIAGSSFLGHIVSTTTDVELAHNIIVCLDYADSGPLSGSPFRAPAINKNILLKDSRLKFHYSIQKDVIGKLYDSCIKFGLTSVIVVHADCPLVPAWLIKEVASLHAETGKSVVTKGYPSGISVEAMPFHVIANLYRFREFKEQLDKYSSSIQKLYINNTNEEQYYMYQFPNELRLKNRSQIPMFDALLSDLALGYDLSDLLKEWNEQERPNGQS